MMEIKKMEIDLPAEVFEKLETMARNAGLRPTQMASLLMKAFVENDGKVYTGNWKEGPGMRFLPDWPRFSSGVLKIKAEELAERS
jgi:hypothetical protein